MPKLESLDISGGDGTATAVASRVASDIPLWLCPLGTENLLARHLGMMCSPRQAIQSIVRLQTRALDVGLANGKLFHTVASVGFDAEVVRQVHAHRTGHIRHWHYYLPILRATFSYRFPKLRITSTEPLVNVKSDYLNSKKDLEPSHVLPSSRIPSDTSQGPFEIRLAWCFLLNHPCYAARLDFAPNANGSDGSIDICGFENGGLWRSLLYLAGVFLHRHYSWNAFSHWKSSKFRITVDDVDRESAPSPTKSTATGRLSPLEIECLPQRLKIIEPLPT